MPKINIIMSLQVFLGHNGVHDDEGNELPRLVYVSREKRPGFEHHKKAGAMNALVKLSLSLSNFSVIHHCCSQTSSSNCFVLVD